MIGERGDEALAEQGFLRIARMIERQFAAQQAEPATPDRGAEDPPLAGACAGAFSRALGRE